MASAAARSVRVVVGGWYGAANLGDELLLEVFAHWIREAGGTPVAISNTPAHTRAAHGIECVAHDDLGAIAEAMAASDLFVLGGGGLLHDYFGLDRASLTRFPARNATQFAQYLLLADELRLPTAALAQGVGPLSSPEARDIAADVFERAGAVSLRDWNSLALLRAAGLAGDAIVAPDPGWAWAKTPPAVAEGALAARYPDLAGRRVLAVVPRDWPLDAQWEPAFADALGRAIPEGWAVLWLDFQRNPSKGGAASSIAQRTIEALGDGRTHVVWGGEDAKDAFAAIAQCDACVAMRLHGVLLGMAAGVPTVALEYDDKVSALCDEAGLDPAHRVALDAIRLRLGDAVRAAAAQARAPMPSRAAALAGQALAHRDLLWRAMAAASRARRGHDADREAWIATWVAHAPEHAERVMRAMAARLRDLPAGGDTVEHTAEVAVAIATLRAERDGAYRATLAAHLDRDEALRARERAELALSVAQVRQVEAESRARDATARVAILESERDSRFLARVRRALSRAPQQADATPPAAPAATPRPSMDARRTGLVPGLVSVVLPVYNGAHLLDGAIRSVLAQTYRPLELIVVDDGSTDGTRAVLSRYAGHPDVRIVVQPNQKLPRALSNGFALATGEFWTWTSDDNLMGRDQLERMVAKLRAEPGTGMTYADFVAIDERGNPLADRAWRAHDRPDPASGIVHLPRSTERLNLLPDNFIGPCFLYRGWIGRALRGYDMPQGVEDYDYWMRMNALFAVRHMDTDEPMYWYRVHADALSSHDNAVKIQRRVEDLMRKEGERAKYFAQPLAVRAEPEALKWLAARGIADAQSLDVPIEGGGPSLLAATAADAKALPDGAGIEVPLLIVFDGDAAKPYDVSELLSRPHALAIAQDARTASRVRAVSSAAVVDGESPALADAIAGFARDAGFWIRTRGQVTDETAMPAPFVDRRVRSRVALLTGRGADVEAVHGLAASLQAEQIDAHVVSRGELESDDALRAWCAERHVGLVNFHGEPSGAHVAAALGVPLVQTLREGDVEAAPEAYRAAGSATTAYLCSSAGAMRAADVAAGADPAKLHRIGDFAAAHAQLFHALLRR